MKYELGDIIRFNQNVGLSHPKDTIAHEYIKSLQTSFPDASSNIPLDTTKPSFIKWNLLKGIVDKRTRDHAPPNTLSIHLRAGDCLGSVPPSQTYCDIIQDNQLNNEFPSCTLVYGIHRGPSAASDKKVRELKEALCDLGMECHIRSQSADSDFTFLSTSAGYIAGGRGFGWLSASINPNKVFWDIQGPPTFPWLLNRHLLPSLVDGLQNHQRLNKK